MFTSKFGSVGMYTFLRFLCGGYDILFHLLFLYTIVLGDVGGVCCT